MTTQATYGAHADAAQAAHGAVAAARRALRSALKSVLSSYWERQTVRELSALPTYILQDIGMTRGSIRGVAADLARDRADSWARQAGGSNGFGG